MFTKFEIPFSDTLGENPAIRNHEKESENYWSDYDSGDNAPYYQQVALEASNSKDVMPTQDEARLKLINEPLVKVRTIRAKTEGGVGVEVGVI